MNDFNTQDSNMSINSIISNMYNNSEIKLDISQPVFKNSIQKEGAGENVVDYLASKEGILKIDNLHDGEYFKGVVYCMGITNSANRYNHAIYDALFTFVDGNGVRFKARQWSNQEKIISIQTPMYIEGIVTIQSDGSKFFRLENYTRYQLEVPLSVFIKKIDNIDDCKKNFEAWVSIIQDNYFKTVINNLLYKYNLLNTMSNVVFSETIGTKFGINYIVGITGMNAISTMCLLNTNINKDKALSIFVLYLLCITENQSKNILADYRIIPNLIIDELINNKSLLGEKVDVLSEIIQILSLLSIGDCRISVESDLVSSILKTVKLCLKDI